MLKIRILACLSLAALLCFGLIARKAESRNLATQFSSVYTDLNKQCRNAFKTVGEGQDMPLICKGYGGYRIGIGYSAASSHLSVETMKGDAVVSVTPQPLSYYDNKKVEWRMADGKPFAVIIRISLYKETGSIDMDTYSEKNKTGEVLLVKGLKGYEKIDFEVDVKTTPNPNEKARQLADENYGKQ
ncbi:MAG: hypothetical protein ICV60_19675 [Pyrinomonadaceae bacterium]|nr:hypothetical protein [Pyrinomonadaceae bacterium]